METLLSVIHDTIRYDETTNLFSQGGKARVGERERRKERNVRAVACFVSFRFLSFFLSLVRLSIYSTLMNQVWRSPSPSSFLLSFTAPGREITFCGRERFLSVPPRVKNIQV